MFPQSMYQPIGFPNSFGGFPAGPMSNLQLGGLQQQGQCGCRPDMNLGGPQMQMMMMEMLMQMLLKLMTSGNQGPGPNWMGSGPNGFSGDSGNSGVGAGSSVPQSSASNGAPNSSNPGNVQEAGNKTGNIVSVAGGRLDSSIAGNVTSMVAAAKRDGVDLRINSSFRSRAQQERLYAAYKNGTGNLAAKPGTSNHESGLAIDFANTPGAYAWLKKNAGRFGLKNLPSEPWHYSTTGR